MSTFLSEISGKFSQSLILGTFAPVVVFILISVAFVVPFFPVDFPFLQSLAALDTQWQLLVITLAAIVISLLLYNLNIPIIRFYEGYTWQTTLIGKKRIAAYRDYYERLLEQDEELSTLRNALGKKTVDQKEILRAWGTIPWLADTLSSVSGYGLNQRELHQKQWNEVAGRVDGVWRAVKQRIVLDLPKNPALLLPTRLGNVIRNFEEYSANEYGIDMVALWPRLLSVVPPDYRELIDSSKTPFDFVLNSSVLSFLFAAELFLAGLISLVPAIAWDHFVLWFLGMFLACVLGYLFYVLSIARASDWGGYMKGAVDAYHMDLLRKLGYSRKVTNRQVETEWFRSISQKIIYGSASVPLPDYGDPAPPSTPSAISEPPGMTLQITRGVKRAHPHSTLETFISIQNVDKRDLNGAVIVTEQPPPGFAYEWKSVASTRGRVTVEGTKSLRFRIASLHLPSQSSVVLSYHAVRLEPAKEG